MKNSALSILLLTTILFTSCQKDESYDTKPSREEITLSAAIARNSESRVMLSPATDNNGNPIVKVDWKEGGETFRIWGDKTDRVSIFSQTSETSDATNRFSGTLPTSDYDVYLAVYPASIEVTDVYVRGMDQDIYGDWTVDYDDIFRQQDGCLSEEKCVMTAQFNGNQAESIQFEHRSFLLMPTFKVGEVILSADRIQSITMKNMPLPHTYNDDFVIDCSGRSAEDDIYIYIYDPSPNTAAFQDHPLYNGDFYIRKIELEVITSDLKSYVGTIHMPSSYALERGKLYTATVALAEDVSTNVITYTTSDDKALSLEEFDGLYTSHIFENGIGTIVLNNDVTAIPGWAFYNSDGAKLTAINLPQQITTLGELSFVNCTGLTTMDLSHVTTIKDQAFAGCDHLVQITMPQSSYTLGHSVFANCSAIEKIDLSNAGSLGSYVFSNCTNLTTVIVDNPLPPEITMTDADPFIYCSALTGIYVPDASVETYKTSSWSHHADKIRPLSEM